MNITCYFDGGYDNVKKENGYGSFRIEYESWEGYPIVITSTEKYPNVSSNNEAEYEALTRLLYFLDGLLNSTSSDMCYVSIYGDSQLVIKQVIGRWRVKAFNLRRYHRLASEQYERVSDRDFVYAGLKWINREKIVEKLGH